MKLDDMTQDMFSDILSVFILEDSQWSGDICHLLAYDVDQPQCRTAAITIEYRDGCREYFRFRQNLANFDCHLVDNKWRWRRQPVPLQFINIVNTLTGTEGILYEVNSGDH